jgi:hypothetical protein
MTITPIETIISNLIGNGHKINAHVADCLRHYADLLTYTTDKKFAQLCINTDDEISAMRYEKESVNWSDRTETDYYYMDQYKYDIFLGHVKFSIEYYRRKRKIAEQQERERRKIAEQQERERREIAKQQERERHQEMDKWESDRMEVRGKPSRKTKKWFFF